MDTSDARIWVRDVEMVMRASWAVSSSPPMLRYAEYVSRIRAAPRPAENPPPAVMLSSLERIAASADGDERELLTLPWWGGSPRVRRVYAGLVSFVDDYPGAYPRELFPERETEQCITAIGAARDPLDIPAQLTLALPLAGGRVFAAAVLLHAATRTLARGRDGRVAPALRLDLDCRLALGAAIAPFPIALAGDGDALGDTYHYWATFAAGLCSTLDPGRLAPHALGAAFWLGPRLMEAIRGGLFRRPLFCGSHGAIDRLGLAHGRGIARRLRSSRVPSSAHSHAR